MSEIRTYLEEKLALGEEEWLRREPRTTHPAILALIRAFHAAGSCPAATARAASPSTTTT